MPSSTGTTQDSGGHSSSRNENQQSRSSNVSSRTSRHNVTQRLSVRANICNKLLKSTLFNIMVGSLLLMIGIGISTITFNDNSGTTVSKVLMIGPLLTGVGLLLVLRAMVMNVRVQQHGWFFLLMRGPPATTNRNENFFDDEEDIYDDDNSSLLDLDLEVPPPYEEAVQPQTHSGPPPAYISQTDLSQQPDAAELSAQARGNLSSTQTLNKGSNNPGGSVELPPPYSASPSPAENEHTARQNE